MSDWYSVFGSGKGRACLVGPRDCNKLLGTARKDAHMWWLAGPWGDGHAGGGACRCNIMRLLRVHARGRKWFCSLASVAVP